MARAKMVTGMTEDRLQEMLTAAAKEGAAEVLRDIGPKVVEETMIGFFEKIGLNVEDKDARAKVRADFAFNRESREGTEALKRRGMFLILGAGVTAIVFLVYLGFSTWSKAPAPIPHFPAFPPS